MEMRHLRAPRPEKILYLVLIATSVLMLVAAIAQTQAYMTGHTALLISPIFLLAACAFLYLALKKEITNAARARAFSIVTGLIVVTIAPASVGALVVGTLFLLLATLIWISSRPTLAALGYFVGVSLLAVLSHQLFALEPEAHLARAFVSIFVCSVIAWIAYVYAQMLIQQSRVLDSALRLSRQGVMRRYTDDPDQLHLDAQAQVLLGSGTPVLRFFDLIENFVDDESRDAILSLCSLAYRPVADEPGLRVTYANGSELYVEIFTNDEQQIWLLRDISAEIHQMRDMEILVDEQRETLKLLDHERQIREVAIAAANLVVYQLDVETGYARVLSGKSSWPELWATAPFINVLGDVMPPQDRTKLQTAISKPGSVAEVLIRHPHTGQPVYWGQFAFTPIREHNGRLIQLGYRLITDKLVIARKEAEQAQQHAEQMYRHLNETAEGGRIGLFRHDLETDQWSCNDIYREFFDLPEQAYPQITTDDIDSRFDPETREQQRIERMRARNLIEQTTHVRRLLLPDGTRRSLRVHVTPELVNGKWVAMVGSAFDITAEEETLQELSCANSKLSDLLERQRSMFAVIGHELRTPVASIEMLSKDEDLSDVEKIDMVKNISQGLLGVLEDLRTVVAPERVKEAQIVADFPALVVKRALGPLRGMLQERAIELHFELPEDEMQCIFNAQALRQLVTNLVKNAAIHSGAQNIYVQLAKTEMTHTHIHAQLRVEDDGKGINPAHARRLFEAYTRGDTESDGTGLGLYICSELAIALGGMIHYETSARGGAAFVVDMQVCVSEVSQHKAVTNSVGASVLGKRILLVEDEKTLQMLTSRILSKAGAEVVVSGDGEDALNSLNESEFDLVITDIMMPKLNGYGLCRALRSQGYDGPIIGATAAVVGSETQELLNAGANAVISKPVSLEKLLTALEGVRPLQDTSVTLD